MSLDYDPYGLVLQSGATLAQRGYAGMLADPMGGTSGARYRTYDPTLMRWLSRDPLGEGAGAGQGTNLYGYVLGNPLGATDPLGLICWPNWLGNSPFLVSAGLLFLAGGPENPVADALALVALLEEAGVAGEGFEALEAEGAVLSASLGEGSAAEGADALELSAAESWGNPSTLADHFARHGADFGATSEADYASQASQFLQRSQAKGLPTQIDANGGIRVYDPNTNTFGAYNANGSTRNFYQPSSPTYWSRQPGVPPTIFGGP